MFVDIVNVESIGLTNQDKEIIAPVGQSNAFSTYSVKTNAAIICRFHAISVLLYLYDLFAMHPIAMMVDGQ